MNWQAINFDWNQIRSFLATAEEGSFSAAARVLGQTQPTIGRQIAAIESELDVVLFERAGKSLTLTQSGQDLLTHVREMADIAAKISLIASRQSQTIDGQVTITASDVMAAYTLPPIMARIRAAAPNLRLNVVASNEMQDLQRREADIAIRHQRPTQPDLIAKQVTEARAYFYATPDYLTRVGRPQSPQDLAKCDLVCFGDQAILLQHLGAMGVDFPPQSVRSHSHSGIVAWEMVRNGLGVGVMSQSIAEQLGGVEPVLPTRLEVKFPVWLVTHRELHTTKRMRLVFDMLAQDLKFTT